MERAEGKAVTTLEGARPRPSATRFADTFSACGALQCGFCTPGIVMRTKALLDKKGSGLTRDDAARHLGANLCRCTGYVKILDAVDELARTHDLADGPADRPARRCHAPHRRRRHRPASSTRAASCRSATATTSTTWSCPACCTARWC